MGDRPARDPNGNAPGHATHDPVIVAAAADRGGILPRLLAACTACASLHADLRALALATPTAALPSRPRDFTLRPADAARLRPRGLRRWLGLIGSPRDAVTRPLAIGLTTMGLAGLLVATVPGAFMGAASAPAPQTEIGAPFGAAGAAPSAAAAAPAASAPAAASAAPSGAPVAMESTDEPPPAEGAGDGSNVFTGEDPDDTDTLAAQRQGDTASDSFGGTLFALRDDPTGLSTLLVVAGTLLIVGLGLFALRWSARRLGDG